MERECQRWRASGRARAPAGARQSGREMPSFFTSQYGSTSENTFRRQWMSLRKPAITRSPIAVRGRHQVDVRAECLAAAETSNRCSCRTWSSLGCRIGGCRRDRRGTAPTGATTRSDRPSGRWCRWHLSSYKLAPSGRPGKAGNQSPLSEYRDRAGRLRDGRIRVRNGPSVRHDDAERHSGESRSDCAARKGKVRTDEHRGSPHVAG